MGTVHRRSAARHDLVAHAVYLIENAGDDTAGRFLNHAEVIFSDLADHPLMGAPLATRHPALRGIRKWRVNGFDNYLIFCLPRPGGVSIVRVLHTAEDWWRLLDVQG